MGCSFSVGLFAAAAAAAADVAASVVFSGLLSLNNRESSQYKSRLQNRQAIFQSLMRERAPPLLNAHHLRLFTYSFTQVCVPFTVYFSLSLSLSPSSPHHHQQQQKPCYDWYGRVVVSAWLSLCAQLFSAEASLLKQVE